MRGRYFISETRSRACGLALVEGAWEAQGRHEARRSFINCTVRAAWLLPIELGQQGDKGKKNDRRDRARGSLGLTNDGMRGNKPQYKKIKKGDKPQTRLAKDMEKQRQG